MFGKTIFSPIFSTPHRTGKTRNSQLYWLDKDVLITRKNMKSLRIKVDRQANIKVSCPHFVTDKEILSFLNEKRDWVLKQLTSLPSDESSTDFVDGSSVRLWGHTYPMEITQGSKNTIHFSSEPARLKLTQKQITPETTAKLLSEFYRSELKVYIADNLPDWEQRLNVSCHYWNVKNMRSKWGSCNVTRKRIWLSLNLAKFPKECAQMVLVHELVHLLEASHNQRFYQLMDRFLPDWKLADQLLNHR